MREVGLKLDYLGQLIEKLIESQQHVIQSLAQLQRQEAQVADTSKNFLEELRAEIQVLRDQVSRNTDVQESGSMLINGLAQKILNVVDNAPAEADVAAIKAEIRAAADEIRTSSDALARDIVKNTPAEQ